GVDGHAAATLLEGHTAVDEGEQRVVTALPDVLAGVELGAALAHDNVAGPHHLAAVPLDAAPLRIGVAAVLGRAAALFVCHGGCSFALRCVLPCGRISVSGSAGGLPTGQRAPCQPV